MAAKGQKSGGTPKAARAAKGRKPKIRALRADDLDRVVALDEAYVGRARRGFFELRLMALQRNPDNFIALGAEAAGRLQGYVIARLLRGEFGGDGLIAALDAVGVDREAQGQGLGRALIDGLDAAMRERGVHELQSQTEWTNGDLLGFFAAAGFRLAPRLILERPTAGPLEGARP